ncbi:MAG: succinate--CoA ligase subunit beta [Alphaproteobacteria bacterium]|nr:succinate--CoA ligase subunit beta [Alphaproteobacteria bacterium]
MDIHEYQAKKILNNFGVLIPKGRIAYTPLEAQKIAEKSSGSGMVVKAQIHSSDRLNGHFIEKSAGIGGGIRFAGTPQEVGSQAKAMLGATLVTSQTSPKGKTVSKVYVEEFCDCRKTFYFAMTINRTAARIELRLGNIEKETPKIQHDSFFTIPLETAEVTYQETLKGAEYLGVEAAKFHQFIAGVLQSFIKSEAIMIEINPAGVMPNGDIIALDAKMVLDDAALFRHKELSRLIDEDEITPLKRRAAINGFVYHEYDGYIGCIVNGDGLALAMKGLLKDDTACTLNLKGGVDRDKIAAGIKLIATNAKVEGIIINIIGGFLRCDLIADGIIDAAAEVGMNVPLVVRLEGTNSLEARNILNHSGLNFLMCETTLEAVQKILIAAREAG